MDSSAPTVIISSLFSCVAIAASECRQVMVLDIGGTFLHAVVPSDTEIFVMLDKLNAEILCQLNPEYRKYLRHYNTIIMKLKRALYGLVQSARLWYDRLVAALISLGFVMNHADQCVFNRGTGDDQCTILFHVDDLLM